MTPTNDEQSRKIVDQLLNDPGFRKIVERECGTPIKATVDWNKRTITIQGPFSGRIMNIDETVKELSKGRLH